MVTVNFSASAGASTSGSGAQFDAFASLVIGDNKIELDVNFFAQLQQSRDPVSQLVSQTLDGLNSVNSAASGWWSGSSYGAASDLLTNIGSGDATSLSKFADQLVQQNSQNQQLSQLVGQAKDDMNRIVLNAYDQIGQLGVSGTSGAGGYGPQAMSVINNARKAVDDLIVVLLGQIRNINDSTQDAASRFQNGKKEAKADGDASASPSGQGQGVKIAEPGQNLQNKDGSAESGKAAVVTGKDKDGNTTYTTTHKDGSVDATVVTKDKDGNLVSTTTHKDGSVDTTVTNKDKEGNLVSATTRGDGSKAENVYNPKDKKDTSTESNGAKTTTTTKPDGTQESTHEQPHDASGRGGNDAPGHGGERDQPSYVGPSQPALADSGPSGPGPGGPGPGGPSGPGSWGGHGGGGGGDHGGPGSGPGGPGGNNFFGDKGHDNQPGQQNNQDGRPNNIFAPTQSNPDHTTNPTGVTGETRPTPATGSLPFTTPQSGSPVSTSPQSSSPSNTQTSPNSTESRQTAAPAQSGGHASGGPSPASPASPAGPLGQLANAATQAAAPIGNLAGTAAGIGGNVANLATQLGQQAAPPTPSTPGTGGSSPLGSDAKRKGPPVAILRRQNS